MDSGFFRSPRCLVDLPSSERRSRFAEQRGFAVLLASQLLVGCALSPQRALDTSTAAEAVEAMNAAVANNQKRPDRRPIDPKLLAGALVPPLGSSSEERRFNVAVDRMQTQMFLRGLVAGTDTNMVVHPDVSGEISLKLNQVTLDEVMAIIRDVYGYDYSRGANLIRVFPNTLRTEIFHVDYLDVRRRGMSEMQVSAGKVSDTRSDNQVGAAGSSQQPRNADNDDSGSVVGTRVNTESESDFWQELNGILRAIIGDEAGSQVMVTPQTGLVVVRARADALRSVRDYLEQTQMSLGRQVILEAKIIEVTLDDAFQAGIDWHTFGIDSGGTFKPTSTFTPPDTTVTTAGSNNEVAGELVFNASDLLFNPLNSQFRFHFGFNDFEGMIDLLETQGTVQVLSSPRIATVNNQKAVIKVGDDEFFVTDISTTTVTAGTAINVNDSPQLTPFFSGIALDVTPQISPEGDVTLHIHPTVSEVREQRKTISGESIPLAASSIRESDSIVRARSGEVVVIGGLMQTASTDNGASVPLLGDIPLLGHAFSHKQQKGRKSELVILLRPVVVDATTQEQTLQQSLDRVRVLEAMLKRETDS